MEWSGRFKTGGVESKKTYGKFETLILSLDKPASLYTCNSPMWFVIFKKNHLFSFY